MVYGFKFVAKQSNDGWVTVSEFNIADKDIADMAYTVYVEAEKGGTVSGGKDVAAGESVKSHTHRTKDMHLKDGIVQQVKKYPKKQNTHLK